MSRREVGGHGARRSVAWSDAGIKAMQARDRLGPPMKLETARPGPGPATAQRTGPLVRQTAGRSGPAPRASIPFKFARPACAGPVAPPIPPPAPGVRVIRVTCDSDVERNRPVRDRSARPPASSLRWAGLRWLTTPTHRCHCPPNPNHGTQSPRSLTRRCEGETLQGATRERGNRRADSRASRAPGRCAVFVSRGRSWREVRTCAGVGDKTEQSSIILHLRPACPFRNHLDPTMDERTDCCLDVLHR
jgi:hypothetical protein